MNEQVELQSQLHQHLEITEHWWPICGWLPSLISTTINLKGEPYCINSNKLPNGSKIPDGWEWETNPWRHVSYKNHPTNTWLRGKVMERHLISKRPSEIGFIKDNTGLRKKNLIPAKLFEFGTVLGGEEFERFLKETNAVDARVTVQYTNAEHTECELVLYVFIHNGTTITKQLRQAMDERWVIPVLLKSHTPLPPFIFGTDVAPKPGTLI
jgi:hypothetical protein